MQCFPLRCIRLPWVTLEKLSNWNKDCFCNLILREKCCRKFSHFCFNVLIYWCLSSCFFIFHLLWQNGTWKRTGRMHWSERWTISLQWFIFPFYFFNHHLYFSDSLWLSLFSWRNYAGIIYCSIKGKNP